MCGFAGVFSLRDRPDAQTLEAMADRIRHRGPDDGGVWCDAEAGIGLAHRRLSIVDLSAAGHQPMRSASGRYVIVFNGEIYNHAELRETLDGPWRGHSDTETLLAAIEHRGVQHALARCVGMFAFALWDRQTRTLTLARDRLGEKPLYWGWQGGTLLFGSQLVSLAAHPAFEGRLDRAALRMLLAYGYIPAPASIHEGIAKLPPGCTLTLPLADGPGEAARAAQPVPYWSAAQAVLDGAAAPLAVSLDEAADRLEETLSAAIRAQLVADVPVGAFLSGGIDSSLVVALMQKLSSQPVRTFTIGFDDPTVDEAEHAAAVAAHLGTRHTQLIASPADALALVPSMAGLFDEPHGDSSILPTYLVSRLARSQVTVALSGDGGDELFGGYTRYFSATRAWRAVTGVPLSLRRVAAAAIGAPSHDGWDRLQQSLGPLLPRALRDGDLGLRMDILADVARARHVGDVYRRLTTFCTDTVKLVPGGDEPARPFASRELPAPQLPAAVLMMLDDQLNYMPDCILSKVDRAAMAVSLETRVPMLDHRVVELAARIPLALKIDGDRGKLVSRQLLYRHVPQSLIDRPKQGFAIPLAQWLAGPLREWAGDLLSQSQLSRDGVFDAASVRSLWKRTADGAPHDVELLWSILMFQNWRQANNVESIAHA